MIYYKKITYFKRKCLGALVLFICVESAQVNQPYDTSAKLSPLVRAVVYSMRVPNLFWNFFSYVDFGSRKRSPLCVYLIDVSLLTIYTNLNLWFIFSYRKMCLNQPLNDPWVRNEVYSKYIYANSHIYKNQIKDVLFYFFKHLEHLNIRKVEIWNRICVKKTTNRPHSRQLPKATNWCLVKRHIKLRNL